MDDQKDIKQLLPTWRATVLYAHSVLTEVANFVARPFFWIAEQLDGTAEFRQELKNMEEDERKTAESETFRP